MYERDNTRIASSELVNVLYGDITRFQNILKTEKSKLLVKYSDGKILDSMFDALDTRVINICPMVVCDAMLKDLGIQAPDELFAGLGLMMFPISTHDDLVDELPGNRVQVAGLTYSGDISNLEGLRILIQENLGEVAVSIIESVNKNHYFQTKIASSIWQAPTDEAGYLDAIGHTKFWVASGLNAAIAYSKRKDLEQFSLNFSEGFGTACQIYDDMREIKDDLQNGYWSLPIIRSTFIDGSFEDSEYLNLLIARSRILASSYISKARLACGENFPHLKQLVDNLEKVGSNIKY